VFDEFAGQVCKAPLTGGSVSVRDARPGSVSWPTSMGPYLYPRRLQSVPPMLDAWMAPHGLDWFRGRRFGQGPYAGAGSAATAIALLQWQTLDAVLRSERPVDLMTVAAGRLIETGAPRCEEDARRLMRRGVSVVVRGSEAHDPGLRAVADEFEAAFGGETHVQLYATPGGTNSYGWHYDFEDVFIAQTAGVKDYYFRANTVAMGTVLGEALDFTVVTRETSPIFKARLLAGDWLYIPARWWHLVKCAEEALSISVGVMSPDAVAHARRLPKGWSGNR